MDQDLCVVLTQYGVVGHHFAEKVNGDDAKIGYSRESTVHVGEEVQACPFMTSIYLEARGNNLSNWRRSHSSSPKRLYMETQHHEPSFPCPPFMSLRPVEEEDGTRYVFSTTESSRSIFSTTFDTTTEHRNNYYYCNKDTDEIDDDYYEYAARIREEMKRIQRSLRWGTFAINTASPITRGGTQLQHQHHQQQQEQQVENFIETMSDNIESHFSVDETMSSTDSHNKASEEKASLSEEELIRRQLRIKEEEVDNLHYKLSILEQTTSDDAQLINTLQMKNSKLKECYYYQIAKMTASHANNLKELDMRYNSHWER